MKLSKDRPKELHMPTELWYYCTLPREEDKEVMITAEQWEERRGYEPMMYHKPYEEYVEAFQKRQEIKYDYMARVVVVRRDTVDQVYEQVTSLPDFVGWIITGD